MEEVMLTTTDNPYDPFTQYDEWYAFDTLNGYNTCEYLGAIALTSPELSYLDQLHAVEEAIDQIVKLNVLGLYKKVTRTI